MRLPLYLRTVLGTAPHCTQCLRKASRVPDEPQSCPTPEEGEAALGDLRQQIENARHRLAEQWNHMRSVEITATDADPGAEPGV